MLRGVVVTSIESTAGSTRPPPFCTAVASPSRRSGTETVIASSRFTWMKSTWVTVRRTGWRWSSLTIAGYTVPSTVRSRTVFRPAAPDRAMRRSRRSTATDTGVMPRPYSTAGMWSAVRMRRAAGLPVGRPVLATSTVDAMGVNLLRSGRGKTSARS